MPQHSNIAIGTSSHLMKHSHGKGLAYISIKAKEVIGYVKAHDLEIRFSGEDSFRSDFAEILKLYSTVDRLGVNRVGIADTVGFATPREVFDKIDTLRRVVALTSRPMSTMTRDVLPRASAALSSWSHACQHYSARHRWAEWHYVSRGSYGMSDCGGRQVHCE